jgi:hypothetical protein
MKLVYTKTGELVRLGDKVTLSDGTEAVVTFFAPPHKPSSSGKISVKWGGNESSWSEFYVSVVGAEWIEREDRADWEVN